MADAKVSDLTVATSAVAADLVPIVDVSDTTMAASGTTKKITVENLFHVQPTGTENVLMGSAGSASLSGTGNTTLGNLAGEDLTVGNSNTLIGNKAGGNIAGSGDGNLIGALNTCVGSEAGGGLTTGYANVAIGQKALNTATTTSGNVAIGKSALANPAASRVIAIGQGACETGTGAVQDAVYIGYTSGGTNRANNTVAVGADANTGTGADSVVIGQAAGRSGATSGDSVIIGKSAGNSLTTGGSNVLIGKRAGVGETTNTGSVVIGAYAGESGAGTNRNVLIGYSTRVPSGTTNTFVSGSVGDIGGSTIASITNVHFGNGVVAPAPVDYAINGTGGSGTDIGGGDVTIAGGKGTGSGAGGSVKISTAAAGSTGATLNTPTTHLEVNSAGLILLPTIPTSDPSVAGALWNDGGTLKVSAG